MGAAPGGNLTRGAAPLTRSLSLGRAGDCQARRRAREETAALFVTRCGSWPAPRRRTEQQTPTGKASARGWGTGTRAYRVGRGASAPVAAVLPAERGPAGLGGHMGLGMQRACGLMGPSGPPLTQMAHASYAQRASVLAQLRDALFALGYVFLNTWVRAVYTDGRSWVSGVHAWGAVWLQGGAFVIWAMGPCGSHDAACAQVCACPLCRRYGCSSTGRTCGSVEARIA